MGDGDVCIEKTPSGASHTFRLFPTSMASTALTYTSAEPRESSSPSILNLLLNPYRTSSWITYGIDPITLLGSTSNPTTFPCLQRNMQALAAQKVPAQASTTRFPGLLNFCTMPFIQIVFFCSGRIDSLKPDSSPFLLYTRSFHGSLRILGIRFSTQDASSAPLQARPRQRYHSYAITLISTPRNVRLALQGFCCLVSCSVDSVYSD